MESNREWFMYLCDGRVCVSLKRLDKDAVCYGFAFRHKNDRNRHNKARARVIASGRRDKDPWTVFPSGGKSPTKDDLVRNVLDCYQEYRRDTGNNMMQFSALMSIPTWFIKEIRKEIRKKKVTAESGVQK